MDMYLLNGWVALFQFLLGLPLTPLAYKLQFPDQPLSGLFTNIGQSFTCLFLGDSGDSGDTCKYVIIVVIGEIAINIMFNLVLTLVIQRGSALLVFLALAGAIPLTFFLLDYIPGYANSTPPNVLTEVLSIGAMVFVVAGLVIYSLVPEDQPAQPDNEPLLSSTESINSPDDSDTPKESTFLSAPMQSQPTQIMHMNNTPQMIMVGSWKSPHSGRSFTPRAKKKHCIRISTGTDFSVLQFVVEGTPKQIHMKSDFFFISFFFFKK